MADLLPSTDVNTLGLGGINTGHSRDKLYFLFLVLDTSDATFNLSPIENNSKVYNFCLLTFNIYSIKSNHHFH